MLKKRPLKNGEVIQVTFFTPKAASVESVCLVGDFNDWDESATPMKRMKDGSFKTMLHLEPGGEYQFRYLVDGEQWHNDWEADGYAVNVHGSVNGVIST